MQVRTIVQKSWTEGGVGKNLWYFSWPIIISQSLAMLGPTIDMIWIGRLGSAAVAGVGVSSMIIQVINSLTMGLFTGLRAMIARFVGAGDNEEANHVLQQGFVISALFSVVIAAIGIFLATPILTVFGVEPDVVADGAAYMRIQLVGMVTMTFLTVVQSAMQASGDPKTPMNITVYYRILHIVLVPFLIFGWWIFPRLGVSGAALTNVITQGLGAALGLWLLFAGRSRLKPTLRNFKTDWSVIWRLLKVGLPASVTGTQRFLPGLLLVLFISPFGTYAVAGYSVMQRVDNLIRNPASSLGRSTGILAAQNLGAGRPDRAEKTGWMGAAAFSAIGVLLAFVLWFWAEGVVRIFNSEPGLVIIAAEYLRIQIVSYLVTGLVVVLSMCIEGTGDTMPSMIITVLSMWLVQIPMAWFISRHTTIGVYGVPWSIAAALVVRAVFYTLYFKAGRWKTKKT